MIVHRVESTGLDLVFPVREIGRDLNAVRRRQQRGGCLAVHQHLKSTADRGIRRKGLYREG